MSLHRRDLLLAGAAGPAYLSLAAHAAAAAWPGPAAPWFDISLAQWSLHRALQAGELAALDFPRVAKETHGIEAVEYVNAFFKDKATDFDWLGQLRTRCSDQGVKSLLIMIDGEGQLGDESDDGRRKAIENHFRWIAAARFLGCHAIRVNAGGGGDADSLRARCADSLRRLAVFGDDYGIDVIVENHGGLSSNGAWLAGVMRAADHPRVGTLPDFGNFRIGGDEWYDRYQGVQELMPWAKAVSAKSHAFDAAGNETNTDYARMLGIVRDAGYRGWVGIEWEGGGISETEGVQKTKALLERVRAELAPATDGR